MQYYINDTARQDGFSLLELVVAVSIMLILGIVGVVGYQTYTHNARDAAVERAANDVFTAANAADVSDNVGALDEIAAKYNASSGDELNVTIWRHGEHFTAVASGWDEYVSLYSTDPDIHNSDELPEDAITGAGVTTTSLVYQCDSPTNVASPISSAESSLIIHVIADSEASRMTEWENNTTFAMEADTKYEIEIVGKYRKLSNGTADGLYSGEDCLRGIKHIGSNTGVQQLSYLGTNIESVPASIPSTVTSLHGTFSDASEFNDSNIVTWDTSNVTTLMNTFHRASNFNQDIGNWDTSKVVSLSQTFRHAYKFNQDISDWDVSNVVNMSATFSFARAFNQDISSWNVDNVNRMNDLFHVAVKFNNGGKPLDWSNKIGKVENMRGMFWAAFDFNQDISHWDVSNVENFYNFSSTNTPMYVLDLYPAAAGDYIINTAG